ncbi:MAG: FAD-dependent oxidoreductase [Cyanobacteria bacterium P01_F01_bin.150]
MVIAEQISTKKLTQSNTGVASKTSISLKSKETIALIGAGIVNLISAYYLLEAGYAITIYDASPDPREGEHWSKYGCSRSGGDARMFTLTEADNYNDKKFTDASNFNSLFRHSVSNHGWVIGKTSSMSTFERTWIHEYETVPPWLANVYNKDIFSFNYESQQLWENLIQGSAQLFEDVELKADILRLYSDELHYWQSVKRHKNLGSLKRVLTANELIQEHPALTDACKNGLVAGAMEVIGFTLNIHKFISKLLNYLEKANVKCFWNSRITAIIRDSDANVTGLMLSDQMIESDHYVISPGVYGNKMLKETQAENKIQGVLGGWITIPNLSPKLRHSLKIARKGHITEDMNVTLATTSHGEEVLIFGSGYGYTGLDPENIIPEQLEAMYLSIEDSIKHYFPNAYELAREKELLKTSRRYCIRPWTSTSLGVFETIESVNHGKLIITGGHNTGGFTQAPAIASAVLAALRNEFHPMHQLYHPDRFTSFYSKT